MARKFDEFLKTQQAAPAVQHYGWQAIWYWLIGATYRENKLLREQNFRLGDALAKKEVKIADLHTEVFNTRARMIPPGKILAEESYVTRIVIEHSTMKKEQDSVVEWIGTNNPGIFKSQRYAGLTFSQMVIHMLGGKLPK